MKHIIDCPESNFPVLSKSKATYFTDRIKMVCPLLFPIQSSPPNVPLLDEMKSLELESTAKFEELKKQAADIDLHRSYNGLLYDLYPIKSQKLHTTEPFEQIYGKELVLREELRTKYQQLLQDKPELREMIGSIESSGSALPSSEEP